MFMFNSYQFQKKYPKIGVKLVFFTFFINIFVETLIKNIAYCQTVSLDRLIMHIVKTVYQASLPLFLT